jgi:Leishmanolysin
VRCAVRIYLTYTILHITSFCYLDRGAGYPSFGLGAGCDFVSEPCINSTTGGVSKAAENEFCNTPLYLDDLGIPRLESLNSILCDPSYQSWVLCDLSDIRTIDANERTYFSDKFLSTIYFQRADNCPIPSLNLGIDCFDNTIAYNEFYAGESVGPNSRCLNAYSDSLDFERAYRPACIRVTCDLTERVVRIGQNETEQICEYDGQLLVVPGGRTDGATIVCPRLASVCPALFTCPDGCFGRGECVYNNVDSNGRPIPTCRCFDGNNTHPSCAPSLFANRVTNAPSLPTTASPIIPGLPSVFNPALVPSITSSPVGASPALISSPIPPAISPVFPMQSLSPNESTATRAPSPTLRQTNTTATDPPTSSSASFPLLSDHTVHTVTITLLMFYLTGLWI